MTAASVIYLALALCAITLLVIYVRIGRLFRATVFTLVTGFVALAAVLLAADFTSLDISLTPLSIIISGLLGVPGVLGMLIFNLL